MEISKSPNKHPSLTFVKVADYYLRPEKVIINQFLHMLLIIHLLKQQIWEGRATSTFKNKLENVSGLGNKHQKKHTDVATTKYLYVQP